MSRIKKKMTIKNSMETVKAVISWPASWTDEMVFCEIKKAVDGVDEVFFGEDTTEFPDLELTDDGSALSFAHMA